MKGRVLMLYEVVDHALGINHIDRQDICLPIRSVILGEDRFPLKGRQTCVRTGRAVVGVSCIRQDERLYVTSSDADNEIESIFSVNRKSTID